MKVVGLIAEYNPFHRGHKYHIEQAKESTGADAAIVVMSGDFVQRGEPAILPKHLRAECALLEGAALVLELPVYYATASAERFAFGAVSLLDKLGCVDAVCFGSECGEIQTLDYIAKQLLKESPQYRLALREGLKSGLSFPAARQKALGTSGDILTHPNNILGIEYLKALHRRKSPMQAYTITRIGSSYHDMDTAGEFASATAIRAKISSLPDVRPQIPDGAYAVMEKYAGYRYPVYADDFSLLLKVALMNQSVSSLTFFDDVSEELAQRMINHLNDYRTYTQFAELLKTRELTYTRVSRALLHILLHVSEENLNTFLQDEVIYYARILGFDTQYRSLFTDLKKNSSIPIITRPSKSCTLSGHGLTMYHQDLYASDLYESVITDKYGVSFLNERQKQIVKI